MNSLLRLVLLIALIALVAQCFMIDEAETDASYADYPLPKRSYQHIWRQIHMNLPRDQQGKRTEGMSSRLRANAVYRLG